MEIAEVKKIAYFCILKHSMAKQKLITKLSSFFEQQTKDDAQIEDESTFAALINRTPNPGIALAKENGVAITVVQDGIIYKIQADNTRIEIGKVAPEVKVRKRCYTVQ